MYINNMTEVDLIRMIRHYSGGTGDGGGVNPTPDPDESLTNRHLITFDQESIIYYGDKGTSPNSQGFIESSTGTASVDYDPTLTKEYEGIQHRYFTLNDNSATGSCMVWQRLTATQLANMRLFGGCLTGICSMDEVDGANGFHVSVHDGGTRLRHAFYIQATTEYATIQYLNESGSYVPYICNGLDGRPAIRKGEMFTWAIKFKGNNTAPILQLSLIEVGVIGTEPNSQSTSALVIQSGSEGGIGRVSHWIELGFTIMLESTTKNLHPSDFVGYSSVSLITPRNSIDVTFNIEVGLQGRRIGDEIEIIFANVGGRVILNSNNQMLINGVQGFNLPIRNKLVGKGTNVLEDANQYVFGFYNNVLVTELIE